MTNESEACTILKNSIIAYGGLCYKIPDPSSMYTKTIQRPFDMIGAINNRPLYAEVKYMNGLKSFDLSRIEEHQLTSLTDYSHIPDAICLIILGINAGRGDKRFYFFKDMAEIKNRRDSKSNFLKKDLSAMFYCPVKKNLIDIQLLMSEYLGEE